MITDAFLLIVWAITAALLTPLSYFADVSVNSNFGSALNWAGQGLATINLFFPITTLFYVFLAILAVETIIATYKIIMWAIRRIPGQS